MTQLHTQSKQDTRPRVPFHTLRVGDKYTHDHNVHTVVNRFDTHMVIRRRDDWLCTINKGDYGWDKGIVKI